MVEKAFGIFRETSQPGENTPPTIHSKYMTDASIEKRENQGNVFADIQLEGEDYELDRNFERDNEFPESAYYEDLELVNYEESNKSESIVRTIRNALYNFMKKFSSLEM